MCQHIGYSNEKMILNYINRIKHCRYNDFKEKSSKSKSINSKKSSILY